MQVYETLENIHSHPVPRAVAVGNFDGVHRGHLKILATLSLQARKFDLEPLVLTFAPHPGKVTGGGAIRLLQTRDQKFAALQAAGVRSMMALAFDHRIAGMSSREFVRDIAVEALKARVIVVGDNFRFGKQRSGDIETLMKLAAEFQLEVTSVPALSLEGEVISSSLIRRLIFRGELEKAARFLGRPYEIEGRVIKGSSRGRELGFPTANLESSNEILPGGVFISRVFIGGDARAAVSNIGTSPTFGQESQGVETHLLDFEGNLYGRKLNIQLIRKLREERTFASPGALAEHIREDIRAARDYFAAGKDRSGSRRDRTPDD
jgi:riboflavin kinase/FMN adenylyltransferase